MASMLAIGVLADRHDIYDEAVEYFHHGAGNGSIEHVVLKIYDGRIAKFRRAAATKAIGCSTSPCSVIQHLCGTEPVANVAFGSNLSVGRKPNNRRSEGSLAIRPPPAFQIALPWGYSVDVVLILVGCHPPIQNGTVNAARSRRYARAGRESPEKVTLRPHDARPLPYGPPVDHP
jgi:hypothetical protein